VHRRTALVIAMSSRLCNVHACFAVAVPYATRACRQAAKRAQQLAYACKRCKAAYVIIACVYEIPTPAGTSLSCQHQHLSQDVVLLLSALHVVSKAPRCSIHVAGALSVLLTTTQGHAGQLPVLAATLLLPCIAAEVCTRLLRNTTSHGFCYS
jgi:hypothetical protein